MPRIKKRYDAPPITEALYEVFVHPRTDLVWDAEVARSLRDAVDEGFAGQEEQLQKTEMQFEFAKDAIQHEVRKSPPRFRWWHREEHRAIQAGANMCAHNVLPPYTEYESYVPATARLFELYLERTDPQGIDWVGQRYINEIRVPLDIAPTEFFGIYPPISERVGQSHPNLALQVETATFDAGNWPGQWIGYEVDTPDAASIVRAEDILRSFRRAGVEAGHWSEPHVSAGQDGEIVLEWWGEGKKITLYVSAKAVDCIRVWGPNVDTEMDENPIQNDVDVRSAWSWLNA